MLTISKPLSEGWAQSYYFKEFTAKEQNSWSERGVIAGEWRGRLASQFGLAGAVSAEEFSKLSQGQHPATGEQLVRLRASYEYHDADGKTATTMGHRACWDATFSAPKSISLTALVGGDDNARIAHRESVRAALEQLEMFTRAGAGRSHPPETTAKFIAADFEHDNARPVDGYVAPQLHTHCVIFNITERDNGQPRAIDPRSLFASQQFATAIYQSELTYRLCQLGYEIAAGRSGAPEIRGYTQEYLDASSPRSQQIREYLERTGYTGRDAAEIAAYATRDRKAIYSHAEVMTANRNLAAPFGHQAEEVVRAARERLQHQEKPLNPLDRARESLTFSRDKNFERVAVVDERALIRDGLRRGMGEVTFAQIRGDLDARLASGEFQIVERSQSRPARQFTTAKIIEAVHEVIRRVREGQNTVEPVMSRQQAIAMTDQNTHLNRALKSVVEDVLSSPDRVQGVQGYDGAGKTTTLSVVRNAAEWKGYAVEGFAPTFRAARQLGEVGVESGTLQGFLARTPNPTTQQQRHFYFVDESSLASTNQMREFLARLGPNDRVLLIGDTRQHRGVEEGRPFDQLQAAGMHTVKLDERVRQKDPALKSAVELLAKGEVSSALESLQQRGRVKEILGAEERLRAIARSYVESPEKTLIVSPDNASRRELNVAVREELKANGTLAPEDHSFRVLVQRQRMTSAERTWASHYEINDVVRYSRGSKAVGIETGTYGAIVAINPAANLLTVEKPSGEQAVYDPRRLTGVSVYREINLEFSVGDRIQFTAPDKSLGVANRDLAVIESIAPNGYISARLDSSHPVKFNAHEYRHFDHGYAVTRHSSQGLTAERVLVNADTGVHPDLLNSRFGYVSISCASHEATIFTDDMSKLSPQLSADISKTSALEISPTQSMAQGISMGI